MPEKPKTAKSTSSTLRSISKQLTKIASATSNSGDETLKVIDDVPLNKKVVDKSSKKPSISSKKVSPAPATVIGNKDLKLKVSHNDAGRVVISLSSPDKVLLQVHVDESVLKSPRSVLKKKKTRMDDKDRPKKKSNTVVKSTKKKTHTTKSSKKNEHHRDLPDEQSAVRGDKSRSRRGTGTRETIPTSSRTESQQPNKKTTKNFAAHFSSVVSVASGASHGSCHSDDSTRSPLDLNRIGAAVPKTPRVQKGVAPRGETPSTEPDVDQEQEQEQDLATTPTWDRRRQKMIQRQNSGLSTDTPSAHAPPQQSAAQLHDLMDTGTEAKLEETAEELSVFSSPLQQRRLQHRQKRLERQLTETTTFRSTRSIRSGISNISNPMKPLDPPSQELDATSNATPASFPPLIPDANTSRRRNTGAADASGSPNRATHMRHLPPDNKDDDDSATANTKRIRKTIDNARKVELTNKGDRFSGRSSLKKKQDSMEETLLGGSGDSIISKTPNLYSKLWDKVRHKRPRKDHQKLSS